MSLYENRYPLMHRIHDDDRIYVICDECNVITAQIMQANLMIQTFWTAVRSKHLLCHEEYKAASKKHTDYKVYKCLAHEILYSHIIPGTCQLIGDRVNHQLPVSYRFKKKRKNQNCWR